MRLSEIVQLSEGDTSLDALTQVLLLMKHGQLSKEKANELASSLRNIRFFVGKKRVDTNISWSVDRFTNALKIQTASLPGSWRSGPAAMGRGSVVAMLQHYGFEVSRFPQNAFTRTETHGNGPHIYFWGPGTPPADPKYADKVLHHKKMAS